MVNFYEQQYLSSNKENNVNAYFFEPQCIELKGIVQISHGMTEHMGRYTEFAEFLAENGYIVCGNDHLGHGKTSDLGGIDGYFGDKDGKEFVLQDLYALSNIAKEKYPNLPLILFGHSMGSFFARLYAAKFKNQLSALIISGTGGPNPLSDFAIFLSNCIKTIHGTKHRSKLINDVAFKNNLARIKDSTSPLDWLSRDKEVLKKYAADKKCTFLFTASAFEEVFRAIKECNSVSSAEKIEKELPILIFSGEEDCIGNYGEGIKKVYELYKNAGLSNVSMKLYKDGRHEMLNETNKQEVFDDLLCWIDNSIKGK